MNSSSDLGFLPWSKPLFSYVAVLDAQGLPIYPVLTPRKWSCFIVCALFVGYQWLLFLGGQRLADAVLSTKSKHTYVKR